MPNAELLDGVKQPTSLGVPQGGPFSPLLANIVLHELDEYLERQGRHFARYADDFVIFVRSTSAAQRVKTRVARFLERRLKLSINTDKSRVVPRKELELASALGARKSSGAIKHYTASSIG